MTTNTTRTELDDADSSRNERGRVLGHPTPQSCRSNPAMRDYNADDNSDDGHEQTAANNCEQFNTTTTLERNGETMGALELEYPGAVLYRDLFRRYLPEIADWLIAHQEVRFLTEAAYNLYLAGEHLFDTTGVTERTAYSVLSMAEQLADTLIVVCDALASVYRMEHGYPARDEMR